MPQESRALGPWTLAALVVANMIGAGVFTTSGFALGDLGSPLRVLAAWFVGGLLSLCGALSYGALARLMPDSGGEYLYLSRILHPIAGFIAGWVSLLAGFTGAIAYAALTFAAYVLPGPAPALSAEATATGAIGIAVLLHALRVRQGTWVQNTAVALELLLMLGFCTYAAFGAGVSSWSGLAELRSGSYAVPPFSSAKFAMSLLWISFSYSGFNAAVYLAGQVPSARERIPRALVLGTAVTMLTYLALNAVFVLAPPFASVASRGDIAAVAAGTVGGALMSKLVRLVIALALFSSVSAMVMAGPRVYAKMADDGLLPPALRLRGETPTAAVMLQGLLAAAVVWVTGLRQLLSYLGFTLALSTVLTVSALFVAVGRDPSRARALAGYPWAPVLFVSSTLLFAALAASVNPREMLAAILTLGSGAVLFLLARRRWQLVR